MKSIIYDVNCLFYFLKINRINLLKKEFKKIIISNKVYNTLSNPSIPSVIRDNLNSLIDEGFVKIEEITLNTDTFDLYYQITNDNKNEILGEGEASSIALAVTNNRKIAYNNPKIISKYLKEYDLKCITINDILDSLYKKDFIDDNELSEIINEINKI